MDGAVDQDAPPLAQRVRNARSLKELPLHPTPPPPPPHQPTQLQPCPPLQHLPPPQRRPSIGQNGCAHECGGDAAGVEEQVRHSAPLASLVRPAPLSREGSLRASAHGLCLAAVGDSSYSGSLPAACRNAGSPAGGDAGAGSPSGGVGGEGFGVHRPRPPPLMLVPGGHFQGHPAAGGSPSGSGALPLPRLPLRSRTHGHSSVAGYVTAGAGASAGSASGADGAGLESWPEASFPSPVGVTGAYPSPKQIESPAAVPCTPRAYRPSSPGMGHSSSSSAAALAAAGSGAGPVPGGLPSPRNSTRLMRIRAQSNPGLAVLGGGSCGGSSPAGSGSGSPVVLSGSGAGAAGAAAQSPDLGLLALPPPGPPGAGPAAARSPRHSAAGYALGGLSPGGGSFRTRQHAQADSRLAQSSSWRSMQVPPPLPAAMGSLQGDAEQQEPAPAPMALPAHWRHEGAGLIGGGGSGGGGGSELGSGGGGEEAEGAAQPGNAGSTPGPLGPPPASGSGVRLAGALLGVAGEGVPVRNRGGLLPPLRGGRGNSWV
ncbi:hypothetical protein HYH02_005067 [Chlamydomonas schloesseri]|uniref:Uncharacterized protein n=1 Tax=Chlamydomonas schloesseri TaxID=2026947 RepID=A0A835WN84_9CHLO|nr:hypothetical protein HYH02_005067 [Chlamydomonas schloesseri]|eukprot:KAG2450566.1 hypothetical protein HYH02_005067 [Chlamydomonas schloesseri]